MRRAGAVCEIASVLITTTARVQLSSQRPTADVNVPEGVDPPRLINVFTAIDVFAAFRCDPIQWRARRVPGTALLGRVMSFRLCRCWICAGVELIWCRLLVFSAVITIFVGKGMFFSSPSIGAHPEPRCR